MTRRGRRMTAPLLTKGAREVQMAAFGHARRLGHPYVGCEHTLLALAGAGHPAAAALREHGVTPERVEEQVIRLWGGGLFGDLDSSALAAVGIDVDAVRTRMTEAFSPEALSRAGDAVHPRGLGGSRWDPRPRRVGPGMHVGGVFLPHSPDVINMMRTAFAERDTRHDAQVGVDTLALGVLSCTTGLVPQVLAALGVGADVLRAAVTDRCRPTGEPPSA
jgi:ATP-dependent Clp protease ATP-binding subunit ClpA